MKRYLCTKNFFMQNGFRDAGELAFKAGKIYPVKEKIGYGSILVFESEIDKNHSLFISDMPPYFRELDPFDDLPELYIDQESEEYSILLEPPRFTRGCAWAIVAVFTVLLIIYLTITWN